VTCRRYLVRGRVQGVFFRASTRDQARALGLVGWVRNLPGGGVEVVACGGPDRLARLEAWLWDGPPLAAVTAVEAADWDGTPPADFEIR